MRYPASRAWATQAPSPVDLLVRISAKAAEASGADNLSSETGPALLAGGVYVGPATDNRLAVARLTKRDIVHQSIGVKNAEAHVGAQPPDRRAGVSRPAR